MTERRYFAARDITPLIPQLEQIFDHITSCKLRAEALAAEAIATPAGARPAELAQRQVVQSQVEFLMEAIQDDIHHIQALGGVTKDIEMGLVDFLGEINGQDVWLCWKRGEHHVRYWHPLDSGYAQRRAIPHSGADSTLH